jgi:hypothetical protein
VDLSHTHPLENDLALPENGSRLDLDQQSSGLAFQYTPQCVERFQIDNEYLDRFLPAPVLYQSHSIVRQQPGCPISPVLPEQRYQLVRDILEFGWYWEDDMSTIRCSIRYPAWAQVSVQDDLGSE